MLRLNGIKLDLEELREPKKEKSLLRKKILSKLKIKDSDLLSFSIFKKSLDARKKENIFFNYSLDLVLVGGESFEGKLLSRASKLALDKSPDLAYHQIPSGPNPLAARPAIIGFGPAGLFAGLLLARRGYQPLIFERGDRVEARAASIQAFWQEAKLDPESNVQFGEGGAGTFSDGKLTSQINDKRCRLVLEEFIKAGAPEEILYAAKPHIGTDLLREIVKNIREEIISLGGQVHFRSKLTDLIIKDGQIKAIIINDKDEIPVQSLLLAIGHSARDTYELLNQKGIAMEQKPFSLGLRIEHPQTLINLAQYGDFFTHPALGTAEYKLSYHSKTTGRSAYSFCMCPGGYVVAAASEEGGLVTNGMSHHARDANNANSALLVGVRPEDYPNDHPLAGLEFQRKWERLAFEKGGSNYRAPAQYVGDFLAGRPSIQPDSEKDLSLGQEAVAIGIIGESSQALVESIFDLHNLPCPVPTYQPGVTFTDLSACLPDYVSQTLKEAIQDFARKIKGFDNPKALLTGVETRSSSPVRITRDENLISNIQGVYPLGEGAGYAGGIMSAAVDGLKGAEKIIEKYKSLSNEKGSLDEKSI